MKRRQALKSTLITTGAAMLTSLSAKASKIEAISGPRAINSDPIPNKGEEFNESVVFPDEATMRSTRQITTKRMFNVKPTYHINAGFAPDNKHIVFATYNNDESGSALVRANVETGDCLVLDDTKPGEARFGGGGSIAMIPKTNLVAVKIGQEIRLYDIFSGEMELLVPPPKSKSVLKLSSPIGTIDGKSIVYPLNDTSYSWRTDTHLDPFKQTGVSFIQVDIKSGKSEIIFRDDDARSNHVLANPVDPDLLIIDRDWPEGFSAVRREYQNAHKTRVWVLKISTGELFEIEPENSCKFAWHANWNYTGEYVYYHGPSFDPTPEEIAKNQRISYKSPYKVNPRQHYIGVAKPNGDRVWEGHFPMLTYGHCGAHSKENVMIIDNLITDGYLVGVHWEKRNSDNIPFFELMGKHNSHYPSNTQPSHAHSQMSNDGKWLIYNSMIFDPAHVYAMDMSRK